MASNCKSTVALGGDVTESVFTRKLLRALRSHPALKDAYIVKHNDASTGGIPDFSISIGARTLWWEVKMFPNEPTKLQRYSLGQLGKGASWIQAARNGRSAVIFPFDGRVYGYDELVEEIVIRCVNA